MSPSVCTASENCTLHQPKDTSFGNNACGKAWNNTWNTYVPLLWWFSLLNHPHCLVCYTLLVSTVFYNPQQDEVHKQSHYLWLWAAHDQFKWTWKLRSLFKKTNWWWWWYSLKNSSNPTNSHKIEMIFMMFDLVFICLCQKRFNNMYFALFFKKQVAQ